MKTTKAVIIVPSHDLIARGQQTVDVLDVEDGAKKEDVENIDWEMILYNKKQWTKALASAYVRHWLHTQKQDSNNKKGYPEVILERRKFLKELLINKLESNVDFIGIMGDFNLMATMNTEKRD